MIVYRDIVFICNFERKLRYTTINKSFKKPGMQMISEQLYRMTYQTLEL